ncbi:hypothetical protein FB451DRAFT_1202707 [Mycena latifolia]|nr:hypothetical protein FB451DRAFT_1202707 [Mycena latifolia]
MRPTLKSSKETNQLAHASAFASRIQWLWLFWDAILWLVILVFQPENDNWPLTGGVQKTGLAVKKRIEQSQWEGTGKYSISLCFVVFAQAFWSTGDRSAPCLGPRVDIVDSLVSQLPRASPSVTVLAACFSVLGQAFAVPHIACRPIDVLTSSIVLPTTPSMSWPAQEVEQDLHKYLHPDGGSIPADTQREIKDLARDVAED